MLQGCYCDLTMGQSETSMCHYDEIVDNKGHLHLHLQGNGYKEALCLCEPISNFAPPIFLKFFSIASSCLSNFQDGRHVVNLLKIIVGDNSCDNWVYVANFVFYIFLIQCKHI